MIYKYIYIYVCTYMYQYISHDLTKTTIIILYSPLIIFKACTNIR